jgi:Zn-dependent M28 family amino/carboxypeptidase
VNSSVIPLARPILCAALAVSAFLPRVSWASDENGISAERILAHTRYLASDELQGRAPGTAGEVLATGYLCDQLRAIGIEAGNPDGTFVQNVPLVGSTVVNDPALVISGGAAEGGALRLRYGADFVGWTLRRSPEVCVDGAEMVFVGHGIVAPEYRWNDYKDFDVTGKVVVILVGDPPHPDRSLFAGPAMTYYGRWTYKFEVAAEKGAAAAIVIHTPAEAGYPWDVVRNSWTGEQFDLVRSDGGASRCAVESWIGSDAAQRLFEAAGGTLADARRRAVSRDFRPVSLGLTASVCVRTRSRELHSRNVVGLLAGTHPRRGREHIIYTAHWDHLGVGKAIDGDSIYNGALDNASGVAGVLEIARAFTTEGVDLERSVLFLFTTAEESGLLGARHYVEHPLYPLDAAVATINVDGLNIWGRTSDIVVIGHGQSDLDDYLEEQASRQRRRLRPDTAPEKGYFYRSDHFPFALKGVPALYAESGVLFFGHPVGWGTEVRKDYLMHRYHKPQDEVDPSWNLAGAVEDMEVLYRVGLKLATTDAYPQWNQKSESRRAAGDRPGR